MGGDGGRRVVVATGNRGKLVEIRHALAFPGWEFVTAGDLGAEAPDVQETGGTFVENALLKARAYRRVFGMPTLADDSGLVVDALGGLPGVRSARYAGEGASDAHNNAKLLGALGGAADEAGVASEARRARFECAVAFVDADGTEAIARGTCEGSIGTAPRGEGGFGYDPLFLPDAAPGRTMAELTPAEKDAISHRGNALRALARQLASR